MIKVMSFNIRCANAEDGLNNWVNRRDLVIERIRAFEPDLLGLQEVREDAQADFMREMLPEYEFFGKPRGGSGETELEMAPLMYQRNRFDLVDQGVFWLSETPDIPASLSWGAVFPRTVTWARLRLNEPPNKELRLVNTHFDYTPSALEPSAVCLRDWLEKADPTMPTILTGDFNAERGSPAYALLVKQNTLRDTFFSPSGTSTRSGSFHNFGALSEPWAIDWILASPHFITTSFRVDATRRPPIYPSDHDPVTAELAFNP